MIKCKVQSCAAATSQLPALSVWRTGCTPCPSQRPGPHPRARAPPPPHTPTRTHTHPPTHPHTRCCAGSSSTDAPAQLVFDPQLPQLLHKRGDLLALTAVAAAGRPAEEAEGQSSVQTGGQYVCWHGGYGGAGEQGGVNLQADGSLQSAHAGASRLLRKECTASTCATPASLTQAQQPAWAPLASLPTSR